MLRRSNTPAVRTGLALGGAFALALARALDGKEHRPRPRAPARAGWARWKHILKRTYEEIGDDRLLALAAGVVFYGLLAIFPAVTALVSSYGLFADAATISGHLAALASFMPASAFGVVQEQIDRVVAHPAGGLSAAFVLGLSLAIWSANAGMKAIIDALNIAYGVKERRSFIALNLVSLGFTVSAIAGLLLAIAAVIVLPVVLSYLPFGSSAATLLAWLRWPALLALLLLGLAVLYRFGPDLENPYWRWISPGALFAAVAWLAGSALLSWYLGKFANYDATYGSLGAGIGLMMWLWMTAIVVLVGAEFNSEIDAEDHPVRARESETIG